jgi:hypothetical protein
MFTINTENGTYHLIQLCVCWQNRTLVCFCMGWKNLTISLFIILITIFQRCQHTSCENKQRKFKVGRMEINNFSLFVSNKHIIGFMFLSQRKRYSLLKINEKWIYLVWMYFLTYWLSDFNFLKSQFPIFLICNISFFS